MELGRSQELVILTPNEVGTVRSALGTNGPHPMADIALSKGTGRTLACSAVQPGCREPVTHWWVTKDGQLIGCCKEHWREHDPNNTLALNIEENDQNEETGDDPHGRAQSADAQGISD